MPTARAADQAGRIGYSSIEKLLSQSDIVALPLDSPLRRHPRVTALPHIGSATHETRAAMAELATSNLLHALAGHGR